MIKAAGILKGAFVSRVERNQAIYLENEQYEETEATQVSENDSSLKTLGRMVSASGIFLMLLVVSICLTLIGPKFAGYDSFVVISGSMEPTIPVGSIVYSKNEDPMLMRAGDIIVFNNDDSRSTAPVTHRIVTNNPVTGTITTKGDHNVNEDASVVTYDNVLGKVEAHVPHLGLVSAMFTSLLGKIIAVMLLAEGWLLVEIGRRLRHRK